MSFLDSNVTSFFSQALSDHYVQWIKSLAIVATAEDRLGDPDLKPISERLRQAVYHHHLALIHMMVWLLEALCGKLKALLFSGRCHHGSLTVVSNRIRAASTRISQRRQRFAYDLGCGRFGSAVNFGGG